MAGICLPLELCKGTVSGNSHQLWKFPPVTWSQNALQQRYPLAYIQNSQLGWYRIIGGHVSYPTDSPHATIHRLFSSLVSGSHPAHTRKHRSDCSWVWHHNNRIKTGLPQGNNFWTSLVVFLRKLRFKFLWLFIFYQSNQIVLLFNPLWCPNWGPMFPWTLQMTITI